MPLQHLVSGKDLEQEPVAAAKTVQEHCQGHERQLRPVLLMRRCRCAPSC
jgi:hypothetical protein